MMNPLRLTPPVLAAAMLLLPVAQAGTAAVPAPAAPLTLVACAPGYPGNTADAQPTMDGLAAALAEALSWPADRIQAVYHETATGGVQRLGDADAVLAMVPMPFLMRYGDELALTPVLSAETKDGADEVWSLVARRDRIDEAADLSGWEILGQPCYAPEFVRRDILGKWGQLPGDVSLTFSARVLSGLRRAAAGESVAVIVDRSQAEAMKGLPFAADLEVVTRSRPLPATLICTVGSHGDPAHTQALTAALVQMVRSESGRTALEGIRIKRCRPLDASTQRLLTPAAGATP